MTRRKRSARRQWEIDSHNGGMPTFKETGWDGNKHQNLDHPAGRFNGQEYDWENRRTKKDEPTDA